MKKSARIVGAIFILLSIADILFLAMGNETVPKYIKPFLMPSLMASALLELLPEHKGYRTRMMTIGLCLHTLGDIMLIFDEISFVFFALGLGAFLIGHFFYLAALLSGIGALKGWKEFTCLFVPPVVAPLAVSLFDTEWPMSGVLSVYALTLSYLVVTGVIWALRGRKDSLRVILGGILFIVSDALIAISVFSGIDFPIRHALVLATYLPAEWLLVSAMVRSQIK